MQIPTVIGSGLSGFAHATGDVTQASIWIFLTTWKFQRTSAKTRKWRVFVGYQLSNNYHLELAVLALARIMCAYFHSQNGSAILAQA